MNIAAFDLSLTATGFATTYAPIEGRPGVRTGGLCSGIIEPAKMSGIARLRYIRDLVLDIAADTDLIVLEGLAFGAKGNAMLDLAGLAAVVRVGITERDLLFVDVPPASLKLFATGKGNAPKDEVLAAAIRKIGYAGHDHNEADALWLLELALAGVGIAHGHNEAQRRALVKITWPDLAIAR